MKPILSAVSLCFAVLLFAGCTDSGGYQHTTTPAPISVSFRQAMTNGNGYVMQVKNDSDQKLDCRVESADHSISHQFSVGAGDTKDLGLLQVGRAFRPKETGTISVNGFANKDFTAP